MSIDENAAQAVRLRHTNHRIIDRAVAVRMVFTQTIANNTRALLVRLIRRDAQFVKREENASLDGLETIFHARQRPFENDVLCIRDHGNVHDLFHGPLNDLMLRLILHRFGGLSACHYLLPFPSCARNVSTLLKSAYVVI